MPGRGHPFTSEASGWPRPVSAGATLWSTTSAGQGSNHSDLGERAFVHLVDLLGEVGLAVAALDLHRRGDLAGFDAEVAREDGELLDGLPPVELAVELLDVAGDQLLSLGRRADLGVALAVQRAARGPGLDRVLVQGDQHGDEVAGLADHDGLRGVRADGLEYALDVRRRDVLAADR